MKATIGNVEVDGTPEEIGELIRSLSNNFSPESVPASGSQDSSKFVSEDVAFKVLKRRSLSREQIAVLTTLRDKGAAWTTAKELQKVTKYEPAQLAGLLGAFGKRVASTPGYENYSLFFDQEWDYENDCNRYRLPATVFAAVRRAGL